MLLLDRTGEIDDLWPRICDETPLPTKGRALIGPGRLEAAAKLPVELGLAIANDTPVREVAPWFSRLALIEVAFPSFADGRGFSVARCLRDLGFPGRLRAHGPVIADQFAYLLACGFDEVAVHDAVAARQPAAQWMDRLGAISLQYQRGPAGRGPILERRRSHA